MMRKLLCIVIVAALMAGLCCVEALPVEPASPTIIQKKRPKKPKRKAPRRRVFRRPTPPLSQAERQQLLRSFSNAAINQELDHRLLTLFTLEELQAEAARRGIR